MNDRNAAATFFNRAHLVQGGQILASIFCMLGVTFLGLDRRSLGFIQPTTIIWLGAGVLLAAVVAIVSGRARSGLAPLVSGGIMGLLFLGSTWLLAKTGG